MEDVYRWYLVKDSRFFTENPECTKEQLESLCALKYPVFVVITSRPGLLTLPDGDLERLLREYVRLKYKKDE